MVLRFYIFSLSLVLKVSPYVWSFSVLAVLRTPLLSICADHSKLYYSDH